MKTKARANLEASRVLMERGLFDPAMSRLYYALFQAGVYALDALKKHPEDLGPYSEWKHSTVRESAWLMRRNPDDRDLFRGACNLREQADYRKASVSRRQVESLFPEIEAFVAEVCP